MTGFLAGNHARIDTVPADFTGQPRIFDFRATVHDDLDAGGFCTRGRFVVAHGQLRPDNLGQRLERQNLVDDRRHRLRGAEDVHHVDRHRNVGEPRIGQLAENLLARLPRIDRDDTE